MDNVGGPWQTQGLAEMRREQLRAEMEKAIADLEALEELRHGFWGQTGVHIGMRVLKSARRQFEREELRGRVRVGAGASATASRCCWRTLSWSILTTPP